MILSKIGACFALVITCASSVSAFADELRVNEVLTVNHPLYSANHNYYALMQSDGNFVVYKNDGSGKSLWSTGTNGSAAVKAIMQNDGNFVLYDAQMHPVWATYKYGNNNVFYVDDNGFAVVKTAIKVWDTNTGSGVYPQGVVPTVFSYGFHFQVGAFYPSASSAYRLVFQGDGNLVLYGNGGVALWNSKTNGKGGKSALVSGTIDIFDSAPNVIWQSPRSSNTYGYSKDSVEYGASYFVLMPDGDLQSWAPITLWKASSGDTFTAPGGDGPGCYGPPEGCIPDPIPVYTINY